MDANEEEECWRDLVLYGIYATLTNKDGDTKRIPIEDIRIPFEDIIESP